MKPSLWSVAILSSNKFLAKLQVDLFRNEGARPVVVISNPSVALKTVEDYRTNVIVVDLSETPDTNLQVVRDIRKSANNPSKEGFIFAVSSKMTLKLVEQCRNAGVNAAIGLPLSRASLINTVVKVIARPRAFIDVEGYHGPCRRAGIFSVNTEGERRRAGDGEEAFNSSPNREIAEAS